MKIRTKTFIRSNKIEYPNLLLQTFCIAGLAALTMIGCGPDTSNWVPVTYTVPVIDEPVRTCVNNNPLKNPYFGDTHVHTSYSFDAEVFKLDLTPDDAYAYAKGTTVGFPPLDINGDFTEFETIDRPLDFVMVSDHAEMFGETTLCNNPASPVYDTYDCVLYRQRYFQSFITFAPSITGPQNDPGAGRRAFCGINGAFCEDNAITIWQLEQIAAEAAYDRSNDCEFTSFIGYEWSGSPESVEGFQANIHRNVLFANANVPARAFSYLNGGHPEDLWDHLTSECLNAPAIGNDSCDVITIPHNANLSFGLMFEQKDKNGNDIDAAYAQKRAAFEPIIEMVQHKGSSECGLDSTNFLGGSDEECDFEALPWGQIGFTFNMIAPEGFPISFPFAPPVNNSFVRDALKEGLAVQNDIGVNPFKYGMIGSTDTHTATPGMVMENDYQGHVGQITYTAEEPVSFDPNVDLGDLQEHNPGGLAVVWAPQNTRRDLFEGMRNKEVYSTSGPRHILRFFGGWEYDAGTSCAGNVAQIGYDGGVPMGGDLPTQVGNAAPKFIVSAMKDSAGLDLDKVQIIKGWVDGNGNRHEQVYDNVVGGNGNGAIDVNTCQTSGTGAANLCTVWQDPDFDASENAFYYARVLENPSCRWTQQRCLVENINCAVPASVPENFEYCCPTEFPTPVNRKDVAKTIQERSWSSPIWYNP